MLEYFDIARIGTWVEAALAWVQGNLLVWPVLRQILMALGGYALAWVVARLLRPWLRRRLEAVGAEGRLGDMLRLTPDYLPSMLFLGMLAPTILVMRQITWPSHSYLLGIVATLVTVWLLLSLISILTHNSAISRAIALLAWVLVALDITDLMDPAVGLLEGLAVTVGEVRISVLTVAKGVLYLTLLLWGALVVSRVLESRIDRLSDLAPSVRVLLGKLLKISLLSVAVLVALNNVGIDLTALALFSGAVGVGIGFGLQKVVSNLISGMIILLDKSVKPGDVIELGPTFGWITSLGARYVSVVTRDGKEYLIPNEDLITQRVINWSYTDELVRIEVRIRAAYGSDPHQVRRLACQAAATPHRVVGAPAPVCHICNFGESSMEYLLRFWIRDPKNGVENVTGEVLLAVWDSFQEHGVQVPYPHHEIILRRSGSGPLARAPGLEAP